MSPFSVTLGLSTLAGYHVATRQFFAVVSPSDGFKCDAPIDLGIYSVASNEATTLA